MRGWTKLQPGDRVISVAGVVGTVLHVNTRGSRYVRVRWEGGVSGRVPPSILKRRA
jgi:preprotein translocase subunit YajC